MNVLIVTGIFPPDIGGPATYVPQVSAALSERGHDITVVTLSDSVDPHHDNEEHPFRVVRIPRRMFRPWRVLRTVAEIIRLGRDAGLLFVNGMWMEAVLANIFLRKPLVHKVVGDHAWERAINLGWASDNFEDFQKKRYGVKVETLKAVRSWWARKADTVVVPSRYLARWVVRWGVPEERLVVIYNGVEPLNGVQPAEVPLRTPTNLVTVGRLVPWKRVDMVIEAIARLENSGLIVVGDGPVLKSLQGLARKLGVSDRVYFAGRRSKTETLALMAACDIFVLNSTYEGFPHVVLEAMSLGLPVIATAVGGIPEVVQDGDNGLLIAPKNDGAVWEALSKLIASTSERERLAAGAKGTVNKFSRFNMVVETERVLKAVSRRK